MLLEVHVQFPERYWIADRASFPSLREDPDVEDKREPRHPDKSAIDWQLVGLTVQRVGKLLTEKEYSLDVESPTAAVLKISDEGLTTEEVKIVRRWFLSAVAPKADPDEITDGRHRLWNCWVADPGLLLPVLSSFLLTEDEPAESPVHAVMPCEARVKLARMSDCARQNSPRYVQQLTSYIERCEDDPNSWSPEDWLSESSDDLSTSPKKADPPRQLWDRIKSWWASVFEG